MRAKWLTYYNYKIWLLYLKNGRFVIGWCTQAICKVTYSYFAHWRKEE